MQASGADQKGPAAVESPSARLWLFIVYAAGGVHMVDLLAVSSFSIHYLLVAAHSLSVIIFYRNWVKREAILTAYCIFQAALLICYVSIIPSDNAVAVWLVWDSPLSLDKLLRAIEVYIIARGIYRWIT